MTPSSPARAAPAASGKSSTSWTSVQASRKKGICRFSRRAWSGSFAIAATASFTAASVGSSHSHTSVCTGSRPANGRLRRPRGQPLRRSRAANCASRAMKAASSSARNRCTNLST